MKVLHVISDENIGGAGVLLINLLKNFDRRRVQSIVALPCGSALLERIEKTGTQVIELKYPCDRVSPASVAELIGIIRAYKPEIVHANAAFAARIAGRLSGKKVVHTRHCCFPPTGFLQSRGVRVLSGRCNGFLSHRVIATADAAAENLREMGVPQKKITVIINGSEPIRCVTAEELQAFRIRRGISEEDLVIGICARLEACKGQRVFLRAAQKLLERLPQIPFRFLIVGTGGEEADLRSFSNELGIDERVSFAGFVEDMAPVYRLMRINVNCSVGTETSCLALSEGMSASLPMVVSDYGGNAAMVGDSKAGILFPAGDDCALADALERIVLDESLEREMKRASYERYLKYYTAAQMTEHLTAVYEELLR